MADELKLTMVSKQKAVEDQRKILDEEKATSLGLDKEKHALEKSKAEMKSSIEEYKRDIHLLRYYGFKDHVCVYVCVFVCVRVCVCVWVCVCV